MDRLNIPEKIETERLILQRLRYEDAEEIFYSYGSKEQATRFVSWPTHQSVKDTRAFLAYAIPAWNKGADYSFSLRLKESNKLIGGFGLINDHGKLQLGYVFSPTYWGKGYATEACSQIVKILQAVNGIYRIGSFVDTENLYSIRVLLKCGFKEEAHLPKWFRFVNQNNEPKDCKLFTLER
ncbi:MAG: GNAT family N-acetyltransferase [Cyclobacteriaceae bacterium]|nr:GNAT family N-acetyltransferase [Cyclobacteriaceae bacterium]